LVAAQPLWAKLFYLVRIGHAKEALDEALAHRQAIEHREDSFVTHFRIWVESPDHRFAVCLALPCAPSCPILSVLSFSLPKPHRDHVQAIYNAYMLHSTSVDPFKLALYKLMGKLDPAKRTVPLVTVTTEDWLWFQLAMVCFSWLSFFFFAHRTGTG
jgi:nuclear pore complex protein Nup93